MANEPAPADILLRLSLVAGFTARHLAILGRERSQADPEEALSRADRGILRTGLRAIDSREAAAEEDLRLRCGRAGVEILPIGSDGYPGLLASVPDAPLVLYRKGGSAAGTDTVALVGSRAATGAGREFARLLAADLALAGLTVVSGMARGIDTAAHEGALREGGSTIAVLGCGADILYPPESGKLRDRIQAQGALLSELPPGTPPLSRHFPMRNRLISGMSRGVVVVEAPGRSGALITARTALDQGREVMAVPGSPLFPHTEGSNRLLREGAIPVTGADDVLQALGWAGERRPENRDAAAVERERRILGYCRKKRHVNEISAGLGIPVPELFPILLDLELRKLLERRGGDYYKKTSVPGGTPAES